MQALFLFFFPASNWLNRQLRRYTINKRYSGSGMSATGGA
jgi:hypothetical protein